MIIDQLPAVSSVALADETVTEVGLRTHKATWNQVGEAMRSKLAPRYFTVYALPATVNDTAIKASMRVVECSFSKPAAVWTDIEWTTTDGQLRLTGTLSGTTTIEIVLADTI